MNRLLSATIVALLFAVTSNAQSIPMNSTVFIEPNEDGFDTYLTAAFQKKKTPVVVVMDREKADFVLSSKVIRGEKPGWASTIFAGKRNADEDASVTLTNSKTSGVVFAYSVHKYDAKRAQQSTAESVAKHLKDEIEKQNKKRG
jgi:hypothetical protein